jgi:hypothetical protein
LGSLVLLFGAPKDRLKLVVVDCSGSQFLLGNILEKLVPFITMCSFILGCNRHVGSYGCLEYNLNDFRA